MALVRALLRTEVTDLTVVSYGGPDVGLLAAAGRIRKLVTAFVTLDSIPLEPHYRAVRESGATIYVNFGRRWAQDFAVTILKRHRRDFAAAVIEPKELEGRRIRVRGWVEQRRGPMMEASAPEQIEVIR